MVEPPTTDSIVTRRRVVAAAGGVLAGGGTLAVAATDRASADVTVDDFAVNDASFEADSVDPVVDVTAAWQYSVTQSPGDVRLALQVSGDDIGELVLRTDRQELSNTDDISGRIVDASAWSLSDFEVEPGDSVSHNVNIDLVFQVRDTDESIMVDASASDTATVTVENPKDGSARVGGKGQIIDGS